MPSSEAMYPSGHVLHAVEPFWSWYVPFAQTTHLSSVLVSAYFPAAQAVQADAPPVDTVPSVHDVHVAAAARE